MGEKPSGRLMEIEDDAFAQDGVEQVLQPAGEARLLHDVPGEEAVVEVHRRGIGAVGA